MSAVILDSLIEIDRLPLPPHRLADLPRAAAYIRTTLDGIGTDERSDVMEASQLIPRCAVQELSCLCS